MLSEVACAQTLFWHSFSLHSIVAGARPRRSALSPSRQTASGPSSRTSLGTSSEATFKQQQTFLLQAQDTWQPQCLAQLHTLLTARQTVLSLLVSSKIRGCLLVPAYEMLLAERGALCLAVTSINLTCAGRDGQHLFAVAPELVLVPCCPGGDMCTDQCCSEFCSQGHSSCSCRRPPNNSSCQLSNLVHLGTQLRAWRGSIDSPMTACQQQSRPLRQAVAGGACKQHQSWGMFSPSVRDMLEPRQSAAQGGIPAGG